MKQFSLVIPKNIYAGDGSLSRVIEILKYNNAKKTGIFIYEGGKDSEEIKILLNELDLERVEFELFDKLTPEPSYIEVQEVVDSFIEAKCDFIIAIGGGSVMDTAKLTSIAATGDYKVKELIDNPLIAKKHVKAVMIPTTSGTGAEATPNAIVLVPEKEVKIGIVNNEMIPEYVILDPRLTKNLPFNLAASTGIDALCHAIECFTSNKANPLSDTFALKAFELIMKNIIPACKEVDNIEAKKSMLLASFYAGVSITASGTTGVHALSYPLGGKYHIPHGVSNAILLMPVMRFNEDKIRKLLATAYDYTYVERKENFSEIEKSKLLLDEMENVINTLEIPRNLRDFGVKTNHIDDLVDSAMQVTRLLNNNMKVIKSEDARKIYTEII